MKEINIAHNRGLKRDTNINKAIPQMTPMSKIEQATTPMVTIGSLDAQDSIWYIGAKLDKTEDQAKRNQELINHLMQKIMQMEQHDRSNRGQMVRRQLFGIFIYSVYQCLIMSAIDIGIPTIESFQDGLIMEPCSMMVLVCNVLLFDVLLLAILIIYAVKKFPAIKEKIERKWTGISSQKEDDSQTSVSNVSTMKKEIMTVDNVAFEAE